MRISTIILAIVTEAKLLIMFEFRPKVLISLLMYNFGVVPFTNIRNSFQFIFLETPRRNCKAFCCDFGCVLLLCLPYYVNISDAYRYVLLFNVEEQLSDHKSYLGESGVIF